MPQTELEEKLKRLIRPGELYEAYCKYSADCNCGGGIRSDGGGNPIFPPCADGDLDSFIDWDSVEEAEEEEE